MIRKATKRDLQQIVAIYDAIHDEEEAGTMCVGWMRNVYPTKSTAEEALGRDDLFVYEKDGAVLGSAIINRQQLDCYGKAKWTIKAEDKDVMVLHTLTISPSSARNGIGHEFVSFYEEYARNNHATVLRIDTQEQNTVARRFYAKLGFKETDIIKTPFQGLH
ncbi:MAG: GNAT family N-acetyltransferase, partial [Prevotella sp.]